MDDHTQERFGRYEILGELGRGAMGVVYKAHDPKINRTVALKTISLAGQPPEDELDYRERFFREAEAAGRVSHPGIVTIFDVGEAPETRAPYIVMEFVNGESLDRLLLKNDDRKLPVETALRLAVELGEALDCAHRQGVVHRDLKPANILVSEDGRAKIADFGVAKLNLSNQTLAGRALGTPAYMSPEQLHGETVDGRSDLFSLGVILYTVLTGHRPFQGNSAVTVSFKVVNHEPMPATLLDTALPEGLDAIIARAMAKDPADRYQSGLEMVADIRKLLEEEPGNKSKYAGLPGVASAAQLAPENTSPALLQPASGHTIPTPPPLSTESSAQAAPAQATSAQTTSAQTTSPQAAPVHLTPLAAKSLSSTRALRNLSPNLSLLMTTAMTPAKIRKLSYSAVAVLAGLFILGLWAISFGPQGVQPRAAEPAAGPSEIASQLPPSTANSPASLEKTPASGAGSADSKGRAKSNPSHRTDSHITSTNANTSAHRTPAPAAKEKDLTLARRSDSRSAKLAYPEVAEVPAVILPVVTSQIPEIPATLEIEVDHRFAEAQLSIWLDDSLTYTHTLEGTDKKRLGVFHHMEGHELHAMQLAPGKHRLRVRVTSDSPTYDQSAFVSSDFTSGQENVLQITFNKHGDISLTLQ
jgi:serine/threonine-protein kinase